MDIISSKNLLESANSSKIAAGGQSSSQTLNEMNERLRADLLRIDQQLDELDTELESSNAIMSSQAASIATLAQELLTAVTAANTTIANTTKQGWLDLFSNHYIAETTTADVNNLYGQATLGIISQSDCLVSYDAAGDVWIPEHTVISHNNGSATRPGSNLLVVDPSFVKALDNDPGTAWSRVSNADNDEVWIKISTPIEVMSNEFSNTLTIHPYPAFNAELLGVEIMKQDGTWLTPFRVNETGVYTLSHLPGANTVTNSVERFGNTRLFFPPCQVQDIYIHMKVPTGSYWGFSDIRLQMTNFQASSTLTFDMTQLTSNIPASTLQSTLAGVATDMLSKLTASKDTTDGQLKVNYELTQQLSGISPVITGIITSWT